MKRNGKAIARRVATGKRPPIADLMNKRVYKKPVRTAKRMSGNGVIN